MRRYFHVVNSITNEGELFIPKARLDEIMGAAPSDACFFSRIEKSAVGYMGELKISSECGRFFVTHEAADIKQLSEKLCEDMMRLLSNWGQSRFAS